MRNLSKIFFSPLILFICLTSFQTAKGTETGTQLPVIGKWHGVGEYFKGHFKTSSLKGSYGTIELTVETPSMSCEGDWEYDPRNFKVNGIWKPVSGFWKLLCNNEENSASGTFVIIAKGQGTGEGRDQYGDKVLFRYGGDTAWRHPTRIGKPKPPPKVTSPVIVRKSSAFLRLKKLKSLFDAGLITSEEYKDKKAEILKRF
jgi:hypothetical protein